MFGAAMMLSTPITAQDATGDADAGEAQFNRQCIACHVIENKDGKVLAGRNARTGPNLYDVMGAPPGSQDDFRYGDSHVAYGEGGVTWVVENTVAFLQDPTGYLRDALSDPRARSKMAYQVRSEDDARDIYAFLVRFSAESTGAGETAPDATAIEAVPDDASGELLEDNPATELALLDIAAGETKYQESCRNCHGPKARGMASFPKLVGHDAAYLVTRLEQYRSGETVGPNSALMFPIAGDMSDGDIANVVAYITTTFP
jgi:cytochrome c